MANKFFLLYNSGLTFPPLPNYNYHNKIHLQSRLKGSSWHIKCTVSGLVHFCIWIFMRQNGRQFHESVARRKLKWQDFYYNSRISSDMQYCNKSLFYTPKTGYKMPSLHGFHFYNNINIMQVFLSI